LNLKRLAKKPSKDPDDVLKNTLVIRNSFCKLKNFPSEVVSIIDDVLTYQNDIEAEKAALFKKMKFWKGKTNSSSPVAARKAKQMCGWISKQIKDVEANEFVKWLKGDTFPTGHLNIVKDVLSELGHKYEVKDYRVVPDKKFKFYLSEEFPEPRYYQHEMHKAGIDTGRGVFEAAVGSGKSLVLMRLLQEFGVKSLIVVPSKPLMNQLKNELIKHFGKRNVVELAAGKMSKSNLSVMKKTPIRLINIQSMASLNKKGTIQDVIADIDAIFIDEIHHAGSKSYTDLLPALDHVYYRFGFTGTFLRNDAKTLDMWGFLSNRLYNYPAYKAIEEGFLTPIQAIIHSVDGIYSKNYQKEYKQNYCGGAAILDKIKEILTSYVKGDEQVLILISRKDQSGLVIHEFLNDLGFENTYISGDDDKQTIDNALQAFNKKEIRILIGSTVIGEGIDIRSSDHLIMAQGGKSEIAIVQAIGRLARLYKDKLIGTIHDFLFVETKYMEKHSKMRKAIYKRVFAAKIIEK
jgi:superfamily II DNA or RNA helicase